MRSLPYGFLRLELSLVEGRGWELAAACGNFGYLFSLEMLSIVILTNVAVPTSVFKRYWAIAAGVLATDCMGDREPPHGPPRPVFPTVQDKVASTHVPDGTEVAQSGPSAVVVGGPRG